jgi:hypothetical protein
VEEEKIRGIGKKANLSGKERQGRIGKGGGAIKL